jgi:hypothetical protein
LIIIGDSRVIIKALVHQTTPKDNKLASIFARINKAVQLMARVSYYHVLRELNNHVDHLENEASSLAQGVLVKNGGLSFSFIP